MDYLVALKNYTAPRKISDSTGNETATTSKNQLACVTTVVNRNQYHSKSEHPKKKRRNNQSLSMINAQF